MRLIDADALENRIKDIMAGFPAERELFLTLVDDAQTVYNVDKVVKELENLITESYYKSVEGSRSAGAENGAYHKALEIVTGGGVDE